MEIKGKWIERTLAMAEKSDSDRVKLIVLKSVRMALNFDNTKVLSIQKQILEIAPLVGIEEYANALVDHGRTLQYSTQYDEARHILKLAQQLSETNEIRFRIRYELTISVAMLEGECGNPELALQMYQGITDEIKRHAADRDIAFHHCNLAQQLIALKRYDEAQAESEQADVICGYLPYHQVRALVVLHQVEIAEMRGDIPGVQRVFGRGETIFNHPKLKGYRFSHYWKYYRARFLRRIGDFAGSVKARPPLGQEPYLDACIFAEQGFWALEHGHYIDAIVQQFERLAQEIGFPDTSEPGQLLAALKRSAAARPEDRIHGEFVLDFPPNLLATLRR
jgi:tetratricopeptide (TPR) repeat protein